PNPDLDKPEPKPPHNLPTPPPFVPKPDPTPKDPSWPDIRDLEPKREDYEKGTKGDEAYLRDKEEYDWAVEPDKGYYAGGKPETDPKKVYEEYKKNAEHPSMRGGPVRDYETWLKDRVAEEQRGPGVIPVQEDWGWQKDISSHPTDNKATAPEPSDQLLPIKPSIRIRKPDGTWDIGGGSHDYRGPSQDIGRGPWPSHKRPIDPDAPTNPTPGPTMPDFPNDKTEDPKPPPPIEKDKKPLTQLNKGMTSLVGIMGGCCMMLGAINMGIGALVKQDPVKIDPDKPKPDPDKPKPDPDKPNPDLDKPEPKPPHNLPTPPPFVPKPDPTPKDPSWPDIRDLEPKRE
ncbi:MAG: hypothetical protein QGF89_08170, partial [Candidatus Marinimicrobia bacterium]|nr:hypothetical protein [Candidatus Neomarinimicrobiota bacterium]